MQFEEFALETNVLAYASRSKAKAKPRRRTSTRSSSRTIPICERSWNDIEPETYSLISYPVSKQLSTLLRHGHLLRQKDEAMEFWRLKKIFGTNLRTLNIGLMKCGRVKWQEAEVTRNGFNTEGLSLWLLRFSPWLFLSVGKVKGTSAQGQNN